MARTCNARLREVRLLADCWQRPRPPISCCHTHHSMKLSAALLDTASALSRTVAGTRSPWCDVRRGYGIAANNLVTVPKSARLGVQPFRVSAQSRRRPVMPKRNCLIGSGVRLRKSTQVKPSRKIGSVSRCLARLRSTGITGHSLRAASLRNASISLSCHGPMPLGPRNTATALPFSKMVEKLLTSTTDQVRRASSGSDGSG
jgi:hypothetical protein